MHLNKRRILKSFLAASLAAPGAAAWAQEANVLRIIVPYPPGGSTDQGARILAAHLQTQLQTQLNQSVIVENMVGAGGRLAMQNVKRMAPDANVLVMVNPALMVIAPQVFKNVGYEPSADFQAVSQVAAYQFGLAVGAAVPVRETNHLLAWMRANPEKSNFGVPALGSIPHFFALMLAEAAGVKAPVIGFNGSAPLTTNLIGGHVPVAIDALDALIAQHQAGKIKLLATSGEARYLSDVPTLKEAGMNLSAKAWNTLVAKSTMSAERVQRYSQAIAAVMQSPEVQTKFKTANLLEPSSMSAAQSQAAIQAFAKQWIPVIQKSNVKFD